MADVFTRAQLTNVARERYDAITAEITEIEQTLPALREEQEALKPLINLDEKIAEINGNKTPPDLSELGTSDAIVAYLRWSGNAPATPDDLETAVRKATGNDGARVKAAISRNISTDQGDFVRVDKDGTPDDSGTYIVLSDKYDEETTD